MLTADSQLNSFPPTSPARHSYWRQLSPRLSKPQITRNSQPSFLLAAAAAPPHPFLDLKWRYSPHLDFLQKCDPTDIVNVILLILIDRISVIHLCNIIRHKHTSYNLCYILIPQHFSNTC